jgi:transcriptional regulator with XRE-family HTH domain
METASPGVGYDVQQMTEDMTAKGWLKLDLARAAGVSDMTVIRFLRGERQTARTAKKLAKALGRSLRSYLVSSDSREVA